MLFEPFSIYHNYIDLFRDLHESKPYPFSWPLIMKYMETLESVEVVFKDKK